MFDPTVGRWLEEDPIGINAGEQNLYRYVLNSPTNATDPSGLFPAYPGWYQDQLNGKWSPPYVWDKPNTITGGSLFAREWRFGEAECRWFEKGCMGLCAVRTGSYNAIRPGGAVGGEPQYQPGVRCFWSLGDALDLQKRLREQLRKDQNLGKSPVLFAVESQNAYKPFVRPLNEKEIDPISLNIARMGLWDYATAFQKEDGTIAYWERMPFGQRLNPALNVWRTTGHTFANVVYCVVVTESSFAPHTVR